MKQPVVALSTTEAEYIALMNTCQDLLWLKQLLLDFGIKSGNANGKPVLLEDNLSSHFLTGNPSLHQRSKHIDVRYHHIRERHSTCHFDLHFINGKDTPADLLTKALGPQILRHLASLVFQ